MNNIELLDQKTIDKIAAGEVVERPSSIIKELVENAIDAKATAITIEIKEGGISFIRITDNGLGILKNDIKKAFLRHSTSKIRSVEDLRNVASLGFRGEALSSISAVSQVELITKTSDSLTGTRYLIDGSIEKSIEDIGAPQGTTFIIRNLFFNTPARRKFLKSPTTEGGYISAIVERLALSKPEISFKFIQNNQVKLHTSGNFNLKDIIYNIYGRDISSNLLSIENENNIIKMSGFIGKPLISRGNRNFENYFINGRYVKNSIITKAIEDAYKPFVMQHKYPFAVLSINITGDLIDVNVHPAKMEVRFSNNNDIYNIIYKTIYNSLTQKELIPEISLETPVKAENKTIKSQNEKYSIPEPFETARRSEIIRETSTYHTSTGNHEINTLTKLKPSDIPHIDEPLLSDSNRIVNDTSNSDYNLSELKIKDVEQQELFNEKIVNKVRIIGQVFDTYWIIQYTDKMFIIDQHAAHEKVLYERTLKGLKNKEFTSQLLNPPIILTLSISEEEILNKFMVEFKTLGFDIEHFGGKEYSIHAVPDNLYNLSAKDLFIEMLDSLINININVEHTDMILERIASMSCKAAVKGNNKLSLQEIECLFNELLELDNPYNCPHGRPTIISMSKYELEKKFKRVL